MLDTNSATSLGRLVITVNALVAGLIEWVAGMKDRLFVYTMERPNCTIAAGGLGKTATPAITYRLPAESRISWLASE